jgi:serine/tyrosine/threonine adenylyltransferase
MWQYSYLSLPETFYEKTLPTKVPQPTLIVFNQELCAALGLPDQLNDVAFLSGNSLYNNATPFAQAYAGHQFGGFNMLGDGRAMVLGEFEFEKQLYDIQLKGSGATKFSRRGDGRATASAMLREYIMSEAMHALGIATTRTLAVVNTGETIYRQTIEPGGICTRIAKSHIRVGTFEFAANFLGKEATKALADYTITRHYQHLQNNPEPYLYLLQAVLEKQVQLIIQWWRVGFIHGVMNTDNMSIAGETIDYGPCAFMNAYSPNAVYSSIDTNGRYAFGQQPSIALWNLTRFAETLIPLIDNDQDIAIEKATKILNEFQSNFQSHWLHMMANKIGIETITNNDVHLIQELLEIMKAHKLDYTNTFLFLEGYALNDRFNYNIPELKDWQKKWYLRLGNDDKKLTATQIALMQKTNPVVIPRNYWVEEVLQDYTIKNNINSFNSFLNVLQNPYERKQTIEAYQQLPLPDFENQYQTFCNT